MIARRRIGRREWVTLALFALYVVMWSGGVTAYVFRGGPGPGEAWTAPAFLLLAALIVCVTTRVGAGWLALIVLIGFTAEYVGVRSGLLFGRYAYTRALWPHLLGVPIVISCAWMVLVAYVQQNLIGWARPTWLRVVLASAWNTAIDLIVDPVAAGPLAYWSWLEPGRYHGVPARNFAGWFVVSLVIFALLSRAPAGWPGNRWARFTGLSIIAFFTVIAASHRLMLPAAIGVTLCGLDVIVAPSSASARRSLRACE